MACFQVYAVIMDEILVCTPDITEVCVVAVTLLREVASAVRAGAGESANSGH